MPDCAKKYQSYKLKGQICLPLRKKTTTQSGDPGGKKSPDLLFVCIVADTRFKTLGRDREVINT